MEIELNLEPCNQTYASAIGFDSILKELEYVHGQHGHIGERIRHLEAVISRARQHQRFRPDHTRIQITNTSVGLTTANVHHESKVHQEEVVFPLQGRSVGSGESGKGRSTYLVAKALGMDTEGNKAEGKTANLFDCNICFEMARDPVLTCCGHLFCWPCFYQLSYAYVNAKECPVCEGEVSETDIIPIYGNSVSSSGQLALKETGLSVPPRPRASRIDTTSSS